MAPRPCPFCDKSVTAPCYGSHILSAAHYNDLALCRPSGSEEEIAAYRHNCDAKVKEKRMAPIFTKGGKTGKKYACFGCKTVRDGDDSEHFTKHPECLELHKKGLETFLGREAITEGRDISKEAGLDRKLRKLRGDYNKIFEELTEFQDLLSTFLGWDTNKSGSIGLEEFKEFMNSRNNKPWNFKEELNNKNDEDYTKVKLQSESAGGVEGEGTVQEQTLETEPDYTEVKSHSENISEQIADANSIVESKNSAIELKPVAAPEAVPEPPPSAPAVDDMKPPPVLSSARPKQMRKEVPRRAGSSAVPTGYFSGQTVLGTAAPPVAAPPVAAPPVAAPPATHYDPSKDPTTEEEMEIWLAAKRAAAEERFKREMAAFYGPPAEEPAQHPPVLVSTRARPPPGQRFRL